MRRLSHAGVYASPCTVPASAAAATASNDSTTSASGSSFSFFIVASRGVRCGRGSLPRNAVGTLDYRRMDDGGIGVIGKGPSYRPGGGGEGLTGSVVYAPCNRALTGDG